MHVIYNLSISIVSLALGIVALFSKKMKLFVNGRKDVFKVLKHISPSDKTIWFHCASLGEYEQGVPIMQELKKSKPEHKIVISFFSPSGFEVKKNSPLADVVVYLPLDTASNARRFINEVHPSLAFFIKYEFWPNYLLELKEKKIPTFLISGVFKKNQIFFKSYGGFMRKVLEAFDHFFVQDENSKALLNTLDINNVTVSGDTRFDRVSNQLEMDNNLKFAKEFKGDSICIVCGSTWSEDEDLLLDYINSSPQNVKFIIAPHKIDKDEIKNLRKNIIKKTILHSEKDDISLKEYEVLIIDCIGLLGKLYSYADIAFVGGAAGKTGLHNILEPATFGVPIVIGKNYGGFPEAHSLRNLAGLFSVNGPQQCSSVLKKLVEEPMFRKQSGMIAGHFVSNNSGATKKVLDILSPYTK